MGFDRKPDGTPIPLEPLENDRVSADLSGRPELQTPQERIQMSPNSRRTALLAAVLMAIAPTTAMSQPMSIGVGARVGTVGIGPEISVRMGPMGVRFGYGVLPLTIDATRYYSIEGVAKAELSLPRDWYTLGADLHLGQFVRFGAGVLHKPGDVTAEVVLESASAIELGGTFYRTPDVTGVNGTHASRSTALFGLVGFGANAPGGFGVSIDLGLAVLGDADVSLTATGLPEVINSEKLRNDLRQEEERVSEEAAAYLKYWPMLNVTVRFGFGF